MENMSILQDPDAHLYAKLTSPRLDNRTPDRIVVVGVGRVGSQIAYLLAENGLASEIVLVSSTGNREKVEAEALDIQQANPLFKHPVHIRDGDYPDIAGAKGVIITSGIAGGANKDKTVGRIALAKPNVEIMREIAYDMKPYIKSRTTCKFIIVSNPVDVMTYAFIQYTGVPSTQVMGTGTMMETSRLTTILATYLKVSPKDITAIALGEHGKSVMIPWSHANVKGIFADKLLLDEQKKDIEEYVRSSASKIGAAKGYTSHAIATVTRELCEDMFKGVEGQGRVRTVSVLNPRLNREDGFKDINACLSFPCRIGPAGIEEIYGIEHLNREERHRFENSARTVSDFTKGAMEEYPPY
ncbi:MAG: hypothetical protein LBI79_10770 [Nitrososphaerota archaeon]|jgi:L-lactate dehydrogenase|nr:hypothetical protein [Nitrososphaerota archaeon]